MFIEKLNKKQDGSIYVIEEEQVITDGRYEGNLQHDNANIKTLKVYTGSRLTGEEIINIVTSVPSETPWKTYIKVFASTDKVYITYETPGDTVEAEDVNLLQDTAKAIREDFEQYSEANNAEVGSLKNRMDSVEATKAATTYVDTELAKKADKSNTYTKSETDQRIQNVIGTAPDALDTLQEISSALNNDPDFAATMTKQLASKVDKVTGKGLSTEDYSTSEKGKLAGIEAGANKYVHTSTHPPSIIVQDTGNRFVTDTEKANWNGKAENVTATQKCQGLMSKEDKSKLDGIEAGSNNYTHPDSGAVAGTYRNVSVNSQGHVTGGSNPTTLAGYGITDAAPSSHVGAAGGAHAAATTSSNGFMSSEDKTKLDGVEAGANKYVHPGSGTNPHGTTKADIGLSNVSNDAQVKRSELGAGSGVATLDSSGVNAQAPKAHTHDDRYYTESESDTRFATKTELSQAGKGDMLKSIYDTDNDGIVDTAEEAVKLKTPRTIALTGDVAGSASFDGSNNISITTVSRPIIFIGSDAASSNGWYKVAGQTCSGYGNTNITFMVTSTYGNYNFGILQLQIRSDNTSISCRTLKWLTRNGFDTSYFIIVINGMSWTLYAYQPSTQYGRIGFEILSQSGIGSKSQSWAFAFINNTTKESSAPSATVVSSDSKMTWGQLKGV